MRVRSIVVRTTVLGKFAILIGREILLVLRWRLSGLERVFPSFPHPSLPFRSPRPLLSRPSPFLPGMDSRLPSFFHHTVPIDRASHARSPAREADGIGCDDRRGGEEGGVGVAEGGEEGVASGGRRGRDQPRSLVACCERRIASQAKNVMGVLAW